MSVFDIFKQLENKEPAPTGAVEYIIVGLGNPGTEYENTRHNIGFMTIDTLCEKYKVSCKKLKFKSLTCDVMIAGKRCLIMKPSTYMNKSGEAVTEAMRFYGIKNINYLSGADTFPRIKMGVGAKPHPDYNLADWVLGRFKKEDGEKLERCFDNAVTALELMVDGKTDQAMNKFNS